MCPWLQIGAQMDLKMQNCQTFKFKVNIKAVNKIRKWVLQTVFWHNALCCYRLPPLKGEDKDRHASLSATCCRVLCDLSPVASLGEYWPVVILIQNGDHQEV